MKRQHYPIIVFILLLMLLHSVVCIAQSKEQLIEQYFSTKEVSKKVKCFKQLNDAYLKPYTEEKEKQLVQDYKAKLLQGNYKHGHLLKVIHVGYLATKGAFDKCNELSESLIKTYPKEIDDVMLVKLYIAQAACASKKLNYQIATEKFEKAKEIATRIGDRDDLINIELGSSFKHVVLRQYDVLMSKLDALSKTLSKEEEENFSPKIDRLITTCYLLKEVTEGKNHEAEILQYAKSGQEKAEKINDYLSMFSNYMSLGIYYSTKPKQRNQCSENLLQAIEYGKKAGAMREVFVCYNTLIQNAVKDNDLELAERYTQNALEVSKDVDLDEMKLEKYYTLASIYLKKNQNDKVLSMIDSIRSSTITSYSKRFDERFAELQTQYETSEKEKKN